MSQRRGTLKRQILRLERELARLRAQEQGQLETSQVVERFVAEFVAEGLEASRKRQSATDPSLSIWDSLPEESRRLILERVARREAEMALNSYYREAYESALLKAVTRILAHGNRTDGSSAHPTTEELRSDGP